MFLVVIITSDVELISEFPQSCLDEDLSQYRQMEVIMKPHGDEPGTERKRVKMFTQGLVVILAALG